MDKEIAVAVCIPSNGFWRSETGRCLALMFAHAAENRYVGASVQRLFLLTAESSMLSQSRQELVRKALQNGATHIMFIDSDMFFPPWTLQKLLEAKRSFVAANCTTRVEPVLATAHDFKNERIDSNGKSGLQQVQQVGLAISLIRKEVFDKIPPPHFLMDWIPDRKAYCGEDIYFTQLLQAHGFSTWIDHDLSLEIEHVGSRRYGFNDIKQ